VAEQGSSDFQLSLAWRGLQASKVRLCTFLCNYLNDLERIWRRRVVCEHSSCRHLATQGALRRPGGRCSVIIKVNKMRPFGDASYLIDYLIEALV